MDWGIEADRLSGPPTATRTATPAIDDLNACGMDTSARVSIIDASEVQ
jgi:hypothetical protein